VGSFERMKITDTRRVPSMTTDDQGVYTIGVIVIIFKKQEFMCLKVSGCVGHKFDCY
jgi:hypothetical protein